MILKQYYLGCLAHASYLVADKESGQAAVVDPQRDVDEYVEDARRLGCRIGYVFLTHFHLDFVAGHLELTVDENYPVTTLGTVELTVDALARRPERNVTLLKVLIRSIAGPFVAGRHDPSWAVLCRSWGASARLRRESTPPRSRSFRKERTERLQADSRHAGFRGRAVKEVLQRHSSLLSG